MKLSCTFLPLFLLVLHRQQKVKGLPFLSDNFWWNGDNLEVDQENSDDVDLDVKAHEASEQLALLRCPARSHLELKDYWNCLWRSSVNADDLRERARLMNDAEEEKERPRSPSPNDTPLPSSPSNKKLRRKKRVAKDRYNAEFVNAVYNDLIITIEFIPHKVVECQESIIFPGSSLDSYVYCLRRGSIGAFSFDPKFDPPPRRPIVSTYNKREFKVLKNLSNPWINWTGDFSFDFEQLKDEDTYEPHGFGGADPYIIEQYSPYRYGYSNIDVDQRQPGWSFGGADGPDLWHKLNIRKFFAPLLQAAKLEEIQKRGDFAQAYPGLGELAEHHDKLLSVLDYRWNKDSGFHAYTRFLLPLIDKFDLEYYQHKKLLDNSFTIPSDVEVITQIIDALDAYLIGSEAELMHGRDPNPNYTTIEEVPFYKVYEEFFLHYMFGDPTRWADSRKDHPVYPILHGLYDVIRALFRTYVTVVKRQLICTRDIAEYSDTKRDGVDVTKLLESVYKTCVENQVINTSTEIIYHYAVPKEKLRELYDDYFMRKESRHSYSLPITPIKFPICNHQEPSPINIITNQGRKNSLTSYRFGNAAYRLNRFFIMFPVDGSTLLSVGIVDGERLDESAVTLTGGAVKGQHLSFQTMLIRFGRDWKSLGSEHQFDGKGGQMELQMIFTIAGSADPIKYWQVLARVQNRIFQFREKLVIILSILVDVLETDDDVMKKIETEKTKQDPYLFEPFTQAAYHFRVEREQNPEQEEPRGYVSSDPFFRLIDFIPKTNSKFYTYRGSLSWPPCFGYVIWSVYEQRLYISKRQFDEFIRIPAFGMVDHNRASENFRMMTQIYVEEENDPNLAYNERKRLIEKRTIERHILEGIHVADSGSDDTLVDEAVYYLDSDSGVAGVKVEGVSCPAKNAVISTATLLSTMYSRA
ncbi:unnamed protein product [Orchesella dallaii]|uniref:Alpha-carbonic anhydrase domain-containing protein n=1 Tax=Orchesella dallaii TaxID=48710 RepID=A0ABP1RGI7_9HEXA